MRRKSRFSGYSVWERQKSSKFQSGEAPPTEDSGGGTGLSDDKIQVVTLLVGGSQVRRRSVELKRSACEVNTNNRNERWEIVIDPTGTTSQDLWDAAKAMLREKFIVVTAYVTSEERSKINHQSFPLGYQKNKSKLNQKWAEEKK